MTRKFALLFAVLLAFALPACTQIDTGNVGVEKSFGKINPTAQGQGVYATFFDSVYEFTTKEVPLQVSDLNPKSKDNLTLKDLDIDVYYKVTSAAVPSLYIKYQGDYVPYGTINNNANDPDVLVMGYNRVLRAAREAVYNAVAEFDATKMHTQRAEIGEAIRKNLQAELDASDKGAFTITTVNVRNLLTDPAIERAIQAQVAADQEIIRKQKEVLIAEAEANRQRAAAHGEADANAILAASLTPTVMQIRLAEIQRDTIVQAARKGNTVISGDVTPLVTTK